MNTQDKFDLFIDGELSAHEQRELKKKLIEDSSIYEEFKKYLETNNLIGSELYSPVLSDEDDGLIKSLTLEQKLEIEDNVTDFYRKNMDRDQEKIRDFRKKLMKISRRYKGQFFFKGVHFFYKIAAVLILGGILSMPLIWILRSHGEYSVPQALYDKFYHPRQDEILQSFWKFDIVFQQAFIAFRNDDFTSATSSLDEISVEYDNENKYDILKGLISLEKGETDRAIELLKNASEKSNTGSRFVARWYLGLVYLKLNKTAMAVDVFNHLGQTENPYREQSMKIYWKLKKSEPGN